MNWKKLLQNKAGISQGAKFLLITFGVGGLATYTLSGAAEKKIEQERALRTLSSVQSGTPYAGLEWTQEGLSSINIKDALGQVANKHDREALERKSGANSDFGLGAVQGLNSYSIGQAAQFSDDSDGLNMGGDKGTERAARFSGKNGENDLNLDALLSVGNNGDSSGGGYDQNAIDNSLSGRSGGARGARGARGASAVNQLSAASMARSSGSSSQSSYNGANPSGSSRARSTSSAQTPKAYEMSGAMPDGSAMLASAHNKSSGFSSARDLTTGKVRQDVRARSELEDITKKSAAAAQNTSRSANEGARAFQAGQTGSAGLGDDAGFVSQGASSSDFATNNRRLPPPPKVNTDNLNAKKTWMKNRDKALDNLQNLFIGTLVASIALAIAGAFLFSFLKNSPLPWARPLYIALSVIFCAAVAAMAGAFIGKAVEFLKAFSNPPSGVKPNDAGVYVMQAVSGLTVGLMVATAAIPEKVKTFIVKLVKKVFVALPMTIAGKLFGLAKSEIGTRYKS